MSDHKNKVWHYVSMAHVNFESSIVDGREEKRKHRL